jgi:hypothetical protein
MKPKFKNAIPDNETGLVSVEVTYQMVNSVISRAIDNKEMPEIKLWLAVIQQAVIDYANKDGVNFLFFSGESFQRICAAIKLNAEYVQNLVAMVGKKIDVSDQEIFKLSGGVVAA